jgi:hypothetical protein
MSEVVERPLLFLALIDHLLSPLSTLAHNISVSFSLKMKLNDLEEFILLGDY